MTNTLFRNSAWTHNEICYICEGTRTFRHFVEDLRAKGSLAADVRGDESLEGHPVSPKTWKNLVQTIEKVAQHGYRMLARTNMVKTWREDDGTPVAEIRKGQVRVFFFEDEPEDGDRRLILTHGYLKKTDHTPDREIAHYKHLRDRYFEWKFDKGKN